MEAARPWPRRAAVLLAGIAIGCGKDSLPTAPSELSSGITVYEHANFLGESAHITQDIADLRDFKGPCEHIETSGGGDVPVTSSTVRDWNDCISSIQLAAGWTAVAYRNPDYRGESLEITGDVSNLQLVRGTCDHDGLNDCVSSIRVRRR